MSKILSRTAPHISATFAVSGTVPEGDFSEYQIKVEAEPEWVQVSRAPGTRLFRVRGPFESVRLLQAAFEDFLEAAEVAHQGEPVSDLFC